ncbi:MAG: cupredoxin domain-containing protein [Candidatus Dojkabacteria bacterium]
MLTINQNVLKKITIGLITILVLIVVIFLLVNPPAVADTTASSAEIQTDGKQLISITAKAGFKPNAFVAQGNKSTILRVTTKNTFDCSSSITIASLGISKTLPMTGVTDIELPAQAAGTKLLGTCSMGMYSFTINFT